MSAQDGFIIEIEVIESGTYEQAHRSALELADSIIDNNGCEMAVVVKATGQHLFEGVPAGQAFCEGCVGHTIPGVRWPTATNDDDSRAWVERCDHCNRYPNDEAAASRVEALYVGTGASITRGRALPAGSSQAQPFVEVT